jgi:hypothetical protein
MYVGHLDDMLGKMLKPQRTREESIVPRALCWASQIMSADNGPHPAHLKIRSPRPCEGGDHEEEMAEP